MHQHHSFTLAVLAAAFTAVSVAHAQAPRPASSSEDIEFVQKAAASGKMEVAHGKMAASKASNAQVKAFANKLVKDHTAANQQLMAIAKRKNIEIESGAHAKAGAERGSVHSPGDATTATKSGATRTPASGTTGTTGASGGVPTTGEAAARREQQPGHPMEPWMSLTGAAFDRGFIDSQVKAHEDAVALFEKQSSSGSDAELKGFAAKQLPGLRGHLKQARDLQSKLSTATQ